MALTVFGAQSANNDVELWGSDGTSGRTFLIKNINPAGSGNVSNSKVNTGGNLPFAVVGNYAYFSADDGVNGQELWRTDGTTAGTTKLTEFSTTSGTPDLFDDVHGYNPSNIVAANGFVFFIGSGPAAASPSTSPAVYGIWKYDPATTLTTLVSTDVGITNLIASGNRIYWTFDHASQGFRSSTGLDGGDAGSEPDVDVLTGGTGTLYNAGGTVYHINQTGASARKVVGATVTELTGEPAGMQGFIHTSSHVYIMTVNGLYTTTTAGSAVTQITAAGLTFDFNYSGAGYHTPGFAALGNKLIFSNNKTNAGVGANTGSELWISDGTAAGTTLLHDIVAGTGSSNPHNFITVGSSVFFQATNGFGSVELWKTDGTAAGTRRVDTIFAGGLSSGTGQVINHLNIENMNVVNGLLYFTFDDQIHGQEMWRSDGTAAGTIMVKDINTSFFEAPFQINTPGAGANLGSVGVFVGWSQTTGYELYSTNGSVGGTQLLKDIDPGGGNSIPSQFAVFGSTGTALFSAYNPGVGIELWRTDGTAAGTYLLKDINSGLGSGNPAGFGIAGSKMYFSADNGTNGHELWVTDGTTAGTYMVKDIDPGTTSGFPNSGSPYGFAATGNKVFFTASTAASGRELWVTDGTAAGTVMTKEIGAGAAEANIYSSILGFNGKAYFQATASGATSQGSELWVSDGTAAGTVVLKDINTTSNGTGGTEGSNPSDFVVANGLFFFRASGVNPFAGAEVYASDGTSAGTVALSPTLTNFSQFAVAGNKVFFTAQGANGQELYVTSGGAVTLIDIVAGASGSNASNAVAFGTKVLFTATNPSTAGTELWISDGTLAGTSMLKNINPISNASSNPQYITKVGSKAYFVADDGSNGAELWVTDGTSAGTLLVKNIGPLATGASAFPLRAVTNGRLLFMANDGTTNSELWITDGTEAGTFRASSVIQPSGAFYSGFGGGGLNGGGSPSGNFASVPGVTLGGVDEILSGTIDDDYLDGLAGHDTLLGGTGNDILLGGSGNDSIGGGPGNDLIDGGTGTDTASYASHQGVKIRYNTDGTISVIAPDGTDTITGGIEFFNFGASAKSSFAAPSVWTAAHSGDDGWHIGDFNGDGKDDVFRYIDGVSGAQMFLSNGTSFASVGSWSGAGNGDEGWHVGDFDGDGRSDIFRVVGGGSGADMYLSNGTTFVSQGGWTAAGSGDAGWHIGDFNGDGKDDIFRYVQGVSGAQMLLSNGSSFVSSGSWTAASNGDEGWYIGDFNGDGRDDIFRYVEGVSGAQMFLSNGFSFVLSGSWTGAGTGDDGWYVGDYNDDGKDDVMRYRLGSSGAEVFLSNGSAFNAAGSWSPAGNGLEGWSVGDFNGDGTSDLLRVTVAGAEVLI